MPQAELTESPEDENCVSASERDIILDTEMSDVIKAALLGSCDAVDIAALAQNAAGQAEQVVRKLIQSMWPIERLQAWFQDNEFLFHGSGALVAIS